MNKYTYDSTRPSIEHRTPIPVTILSSETAVIGSASKCAINGGTGGGIGGVISLPYCMKSPYVMDCEATAGLTYALSPDGLLVFIFGSDETVTGTGVFIDGVIHAITENTEPEKKSCAALAASYVYTGSTGGGIIASGDDVSYSVDLYGDLTGYFAGSPAGTLLVFYNASVSPFDPDTYSSNYLADPAPTFAGGMTTVHVQNPLPQTVAELVAGLYVLGIVTQIGTLLDFETGALSTNDLTICPTTTP